MGYPNSVFQPTCLRIRMSRCKLWAPLGTSGFGDQPLAMKARHEDEDRAIDHETSWRPRLSARVSSASTPHSKTQNTQSLTTFKVYVSTPREP